MASKIQIIVEDRQCLSALLSRPSSHSFTDRLLVVMVHGFPGNKTAHNDLYGDIQSLLSDKGFHSLRFDFRGCGDSDGREEDFSFQSARKDLESVQAWAEEKGYKQFLYIAEGLGASIIATQINLKINALVFLWPVFDPHWLAQNMFGCVFTKDMLKKKPFMRYNDHKISTRLINEMQEANLIFDLREIFMPTLILHGAEDEIISVDQLDLARQHMRAKRLEITTFHDGTHGLPRASHRKMIFYHMTQFLEKFGRITVADDGD